MTTLEAYEAILPVVREKYENYAATSIILNAGDQTKTADMLIMKVRQMMEHNCNWRLVDILLTGMNYYRGEQYNYDVLSVLHELTKRKNHDYGDAYYQLHKIMPGAVLVRLYDKASRLVTLCTDKEYVNDECWTDTLDDLINYCLLELASLHRDEVEKDGSL